MDTVKVNTENIDPNRTFLPTDVYIETTNYCNAGCFMCPNKNLKRARGFMSWELFQKIINELQTIEHSGLDVFLHHFGEPLMDPLLSKRVSYAKAKLKKSIVTFSTNASLLTYQKSIELIKAGLDEVIFSLDAATKETYSQMRMCNFDNVVKNVNDFFKAKKELNGKVLATCQLIECDKNKHEVKAFREMWTNKCGDNEPRIVIKPMHNFLTQGTSIMTQKLSEKQLLPCLQPFTYLFIYWNGDVALCCWDADHYMKLGNVNDKPILELYNSDEYKRIRKAMLDKTVDFFPCNKCSQIFGKDMNCWIYQKKLRIKKDDVVKEDDERKTTPNGLEIF